MSDYPDLDFYDHSFHTQRAALKIACWAPQNEELHVPVRVKCDDNLREVPGGLWRYLQIRQFHFSGIQGSFPLQFSIDHFHHPATIVTLCTGCPRKSFPHFKMK